MATSFPRFPYAQRPHSRVLPRRNSRSWLQYQPQFFGQRGSSKSNDLLRFKIYHQTTSRTVSHVGATLQSQTNSSKFPVRRSRLRTAHAHSSALSQSHRQPNDQRARSVGGNGSGRPTRNDIRSLHSRLHHPSRLSSHRIRSEIPYF